MSDVDEALAWGQAAGLHQLLLVGSDTGGAVAARRRVGRHPRAAVVAHDQLFVVPLREE